MLLKPPALERLRLRRKARLSDDRGDAPRIDQRAPERTVVQPRHVAIQVQAPSSRSSMCSAITAAAQPAEVSNS
jgi:hypothetical protein